MIIEKSDSGAYPLENDELGFDDNGGGDNGGGDDGNVAALEPPQNLPPAMIVRPPAMEPQNLLAALDGSSRSLTPRGRRAVNDAGAGNQIGSLINVMVASMMDRQQERRSELQERQEERRAEQEERRLERAQQQQQLQLQAQQFQQQAQQFQQQAQAQQQQTMLLMMAFGRKMNSGDGGEDGKLPG